MTVARAWASGEGDGDEVDGDDLAELGMPPEEIEKLKAIYGQNDGADVEVWPDHWPALKYLTMTGHWNTKIIGSAVAWQGLDYTGLKSVLELMGVPQDEWPATLDTLRVMERAVLEVMSDREH